MVDDAVARGARITRLGSDFRWPGGRHVALAFDVAFEGWSDGKAPVNGPIGNAPTGALDTNALSWGHYGAVRGIERLLRTLDRVKLRGSIMVSGVLAERAPDTVKAIAGAGHEIVAHASAQDVVQATLAPEDERTLIVGTTRLLEEVAGQRPRGWISPRGTPGRDARITWRGSAINGMATPSTTTDPICRPSTMAASSPYRSAWRSTICRMSCATAARRGSSSRPSTTSSPMCWPARPTRSSST